MSQTLHVSMVLQVANGETPQSLIDRLRAAVPSAEWINVRPQTKPLAKWDAKPRPQTPANGAGR